jgi:hypothetical protein
MTIRSLVSGAAVLTLVLFGVLSIAQEPSPVGPSQPTQPAYQPKFPGDPAHSEPEAQALGYMRTLLRAQKLYKKRHDKYAPSLSALAGTGSFTKRMAQKTERGDYTVSFHSKKDGYSVSMVPKQYDAQHRAFYAEEDGVIRAEEGKPADGQSPKLKS